jgi:hypothetical protein
MLQPWRAAYWNCIRLRPDNRTRPFAIPTSGNPDASSLPRVVAATGQGGIETRKSHAL